MQVIILDTSALTHDRPLGRSDTRALLQACRRGEVHVLVPRVVVDEIVNAAHGSFESASKAVRSANDIIRKQSPNATLCPEPDVEMLTARFRQAFESALLEHKVVIAKPPAIGHDELVRRGLNGREPFDGKGKGYRDALIWYNVLEVEKTDAVLFVTRNTRDFADPENPARPHPDLVAELGDPEGVTIVADIPAVIEWLGTRRDDLETEVTLALDTHAIDLADQALPEIRLPVPDRMESARFSARGVDFERPTVRHAWDLVEGAVQARIEFECAGTLDEGAYVDRNRELEFEEWLDDHTAVIHGTGVVEVELVVTYDEQSGEVEFLAAEELTS